MAGITQIYELGGTALAIVLDPINYPDEIILKGAATVFTGDVTLDFSSAPPIGASIRVWLYMEGATITTGGVAVFGELVTELMVNNKWSYFDYKQIGASENIINYLPRFFGWQYGYEPAISGEDIQIGTLLIDRLESASPAQLIVYDSAGIPQVVDIIGDISISDLGITIINAGVITNTEIDAAAAIARTKLAVGTANQVVINSGTGAFSSEAQLAAVRGGLGLDASATTGFTIFTGGTASIGAIVVDRDLDVSFESGELGDFKIKMGFAGTLTGIYAYATKAIAGTDDGTIVPKNNGGTTMTAGTITYTAGDARGTAYTATPSANNTFVAGDLLTFTTAKTTAGGKVHLSLTFSRTS